MTDEADRQRPLPLARPAAAYLIAARGGNCIDAQGRPPGQQPYLVDIVSLVLLTDRFCLGRVATAADVKAGLTQINVNKSMLQT